MRNVAAGQTLAGIPDIGLLLVATRDNRPVYVRDVASVVIGPSPQEHRVWMDVAGKSGHWDRVPAVSVAFAKRAGANAVVVAEQLLARLQSVQGRLIPADVKVTVTRDYGETANDKANELLFHLALATVSIVVLIAFAIGWREALVTLVVIPTTILLTLFAQIDGLHHQPREPVRAHLLHWHPGRRRYRRDREHCPALGAERRPPASAGRRRGSGGSRQPHRRRHIDRGGGVVGIGRA